jgi:hypothetical protein
MTDMTVEVISGSIDNDEFASRLTSFDETRAKFSVTHATPENVFTSGTREIEVMPFGRITFLFADMEMYSIYAPAVSMFALSTIMSECSIECSRSGRQLLREGTQALLGFDRESLEVSRQCRVEAERWDRKALRFIRAGKALHEAGMVIESWAQGVTYLPTIR